MPRTKRPHDMASSSQEPALNIMPRHRTWQAPKPGAITMILDTPAPIVTVHGGEPRFRPRPGTGPFAQAEFAERFRRQGFRATKFMCHRVLDDLGIAHQVQAMAETLSWEHLLHTHEESYSSLTLEFMSSFQSYLPADGSVQHAYLEFRIQGQEYRLNLRQLADILGFRYGTHCHLPSTISANLGEFWDEISQIKGFTPSHAKASRICHPAVRMMHAFMANVPFARKNQGDVTIAELLLLNQALRPAFPEFDGWGFDGVDHASLVVRHIQKRLDDPEPRPEHAPIMLGGIITMIARRVGVNVGVYREISRGDSTLDRVALQMKKFVEVRAGAVLYWRHTTPQGTVFTEMPCDALPELEEGGLLFDVPREETESEDDDEDRFRRVPRTQQAPPPSYHDGGSSSHTAAYTPSSPFEQYMYGEMQHQRAEAAYQRQEAEYQHQEAAYQRDVMDQMHQQYQQDRGRYYDMAHYTMQTLDQLQNLRIGQEGYQHVPFPPGYPYPEMYPPPPPPQ